MFLFLIDLLWFQ